MTRKEFNESCWPYYLYLENKFLETTHYVHLTLANYPCYSYEYNSLLITISTEFENIIKIIYLSYENTLPSGHKPICYFFDAIKSDLFSQVPGNTLPMAQVINGTGIHLNPFDSFCNGNAAATSSKTWWRCYTNVKHWRITNFSEANLENVLNALAAVFLLDSLFMKKFPDRLNGKDVDAPEISSRLFLH